MERRPLGFAAMMLATAVCVPMLDCARVPTPIAFAASEAQPSAASPPRSTEPSAGCGSAGHPELRDDREQITVGGEERTYVVDAPPSTDDPRPVVLAFHGFRSNAANQRAATIALAEREHAIVVCPEGHDGVHLLGTTGRGWDLEPADTRDVEFVRALLDRLERERCVDRRRVYATGFSNGAFFASLLGCRLADRIAAIAPVAGGMPLACTPARPVPVVMVYGSADSVLAPATMRAGRDWWAQVDRCGAPREHDGCTAYDGCTADVVACEGPHGHQWPSGTTERIWRFFAAHPRA